MLIYCLYFTKFFRACQWYLLCGSDNKKTKPLIGTLFCLSGIKIIKERPEPSLHRQP